MNTGSQRPFVSIFEEEAATQSKIDGVYDEAAQMIKYDNDGGPTHIETDTGGYNDTDTGND